MIEVLGFRRVVLLGILAVVNAILAVAMYQYVVPKKDLAERQLRSLRSDTMHHQNEITRMQTEYQQIEEQKDVFDALKKADFFSEQNRYNARNVLDAAQVQSNVLSARYTISAADRIDTPVATNAGQQILRTEIDVAVEALDDADIYNFIYWMETSFPTQISVESVKMTRTADLDEPVLRQIRSGKPVVLVKGDIRFIWSTMVPTASGTGVQP